MYNNYVIVTIKGVECVFGTIPQKNASATAPTTQSGALSAMAQAPLNLNSDVEMTDAMKPTDAPQQPLTTLATTMVGPLPLVNTTLPIASAPMFKPSLNSTEFHNAPLAFGQRNFRDAPPFGAHNSPTSDLVGIPLTCLLILRNLARIPRFHSEFRAHESTLIQYLREYPNLLKYGLQILKEYGGPSAPYA
jgi:hypothetical protein